MTSPIVNCLDFCPRLPLPRLASSPPPQKSSSAQRLRKDKCLSDPVPSESGLSGLCQKSAHPRVYPASRQLAVTFYFFSGLSTQAFKRDSIKIKVEIRIRNKERKNMTKTGMCAHRWDGMECGMTGLTGRIAVGACMDGLAVAVCVPWAAHCGVAFPSPQTGFLLPSPLLEKRAETR